MVSVDFFTGNLTENIIDLIVFAYYYFLSGEATNMEDDF